MTGLTPDTTYHFRLAASDGLGNLGGDVTFHTLQNPTAVLEITKSASPSTVTSGSNVVFTIVVTNHGPAAGMNVTVPDALPAGLSFVSASSSRTDWAWGGRLHQILGQLTYGGKPVYGFASTSVGAPLDTWGRNLYVDTYDSPYGSGWARENSFLAKSPDGAFCYSFGPRPPYPGYPDSLPRQGNGTMYRITVLGPGVTPAVMWQGPDAGDWDANDPAKDGIETKVAGVKQTLGLSSTECHS